MDDPKQTDKCSRETGAGLAWVSTYHTPSKGADNLDVAFARFEVKRKPGQFVHLYNVHLKNVNPQLPNNQLEARQAVRELIRYLELADASRVFPPIVLGDFNGGWEEFDDFDVAKWLEIDGVLIGKRDKFPSTYGVKAYDAIEVPEVPSGKSCHDYEFLWSDHCGVYVHFESVN